MHDRWFYSLCSLPACVFLSSVLGRLTDVETIRCFLNACIICFKMEIYKLHNVSTIIMALLILSRWKSLGSFIPFLRLLVIVYSTLLPSRILIFHCYSTMYCTCKDLILSCLTIGFFILGYTVLHVKKDLLLDKSWLISYNLSLFFFMYFLYAFF